MKSVLISIQPYWVFLIIAKAMGWNINKEKTVEVRKNYPKADNWNKTVKIYCSKDKKSFAKIPKKYQPFMQQFLGKVIGEFVCKRIDRIGKRGGNNNFDYCYLPLVWGNDDIEVEITDIRKSCIAIDDLNSYGASSACLYAWHITDLVIYEKPKELSEFYQNGKNNDRFYYDYCAGCIHHETPALEHPCNKCDGNRKYLYRPPQSWLYVERSNP